MTAEERFLKILESSVERQREEQKRYFEENPEEAKIIIRELQDFMSDILR